MNIQTLKLPWNGSKAAKIAIETVAGLLIGNAHNHDDIENTEIIFDERGNLHIHVEFGSQEPAMFREDFDPTIVDRGN